MSRNIHSDDLGTIDVYPVGILSDLLPVLRVFDPRIPFDDRRAARRRVLRRLRYGIASGRYRSRNAWNGYLAEPRDFPPHMTRCGHGWTQKRALHDLHEHHRGARR